MVRESPKLVEPGVSNERHKEPTESIEGQISVQVGSPKDAGVGASLRQP